MAKQAVDHFTLDLLDKPKRGRPRKPDALTPAERARRYRAKKRKANQQPLYSIFSPAYAEILRKRGIKGIYHGPNGETWSGKGLMPRWLSLYVREGTDKQAFWVPI